MSRRGDISYVGGAGVDTSSVRCQGCVEFLRTCEAPNHFRRAPLSLINVR